MKGISCNSNLLSDRPLEQAIDLLATCGYDAVDVCMELAPPFCPIPKPHMSPDDDAAKRARIRKYAERAGVAIAALNAHINLSARDRDERLMHVEFVRGSLELAADLGAPTVVTVAGVKNAYGYEQWFLDWAVESIRELLPLAERLGVDIAFETASPPGCLAYNVDTTQRLFAAEGLESATLLFDPAHFQIRGDSPVQAFETFKDRIVHVHAKDAAGGAENIIFPPLGEGDIDFDALFGAMGAAGFNGYIAVEYEAFAWDFPRDPMKVLPQEKTFLDRLVTKHWPRTTLE